MYKTVRHGENSLQYKILAQQEEGLPGVKRRKSPRVFIVKFIAIVTLLIILIMASAFLVPLLLANDFIAVTGTFQKFSVSTLRRTHSGNHVVVIAKKPYGWNAAHPTAPSRLSNASQSPNGDIEKSPPETTPPHTTNEPTGTTRSTTWTTATTSTTAQTTTPTTARTTASTTARTTTTLRATEETTRTKILPKEVIPPPVQEHKQTTNFIRETTAVRNEDEEFNTLIVGIVGIFIIAALLLFCACKILCRITSPEKEKADLKEDKRKLLKPAASSDHDEE